MSSRWAVLISMLGLAVVVWAGFTLSRIINGPHIHVERLPADRVKPLPKVWEPLRKGFEDPSPSEREALKARIAADPGDADARARVLLTIDPIKEFETHAEQVLWFILHQPDHPILSELQAVPIGPRADNVFQQGLEAYEAALKGSPTNGQLHANFANFIAFEDKVRAVELRRRSVELEPNNAQLHYELGSSIVLSWHQEVPPRDRAIEALSAFRRAQQLGFRVPDSELAEAAFEARDAEAARLIKAAISLSNSFESEFALHSYLGILRLEAGDLTGAERHLLDAPMARHEPQGQELPLDLRLAQMLSERDRRETIVKFVNLLKARWRPETCREWLEALGDGKRVNFNLSPHALHSPRR